MTWAIVKPRDAWLAQPQAAGAAWAPRAPPGAQLRALAAIDHYHFARLIEALCALTPGQVSQELQDLAGLHPVGAVLGMPDLGDTDGDDAVVWDW